MFYIVDATDGSANFSTKVEHADRFVVTPLVKSLGGAGAQFVILASKNGNVFTYGLSSNQN